MRCAAGGFQLCREIKDCLVVEKRAILNREIDLTQIHRDNATCADIGMPDFGVAHLTAR